MKRLSIPFLVVLYIVFSNISCVIKSKYFGNENRTEIIKSNVSVVPVYMLSTEGVENNLQLNVNSEDNELSIETKAKVCLENVTGCMENDHEYKTTTDRLSGFIFSSLPPFDLSKVVGVSKECRMQSKRYIEGLKKFEMWALKMYDSTAKLPSGILNGNINQFGDFDMCLGAKLESRNIFGQYCLTSMEIEAPRSSYLAGLHKLIQSHYHFRSKLEDPGHRVPRFSSINWALCIPSTCTPNDVEKGMRAVVGNIINHTQIKARYEVDPGMCQTAAKETPIPTSTYIAISLFISILVLELFATAYDYVEGGDKNKWFMAFSVRKNLASMSTIKVSSDDIETVHGIRFINAILLLLSHKSMALFFQPFSNRTEYVEYVSRPFTVVGRAASLYTDPFIMISGTLTAYSLLGKLHRSKKISILQEYTSRFFRIVPTFIALIAFCTFILPWMNSGPLWNLVVTHHSNICKKYWWRNMLFIHNYFGFKDMCLTHTHHVGIDTQLFLVSPFFILTLWKWPKKGTIFLVTLAAISTLMRYYVTYTMRLSNYVHFGTSVQQLFETADNMYILPAHRATVYIMGILLGYLLRNFGHMQISKGQLRIGNTIALFSFLISYFGPSFMSSINYVYDPADAAWYAAISPIFWCMAFAWVIFSAQLGYKGFVGRFFSAPVFRFWTKISYTVYLTQFPIFFYNVGVTRTAEHAGFFRMLFNFKEYLWVFLISVALTVSIEMPFQNIRNILMNNKSKSSNVLIEKKAS